MNYVLSDRYICIRNMFGSCVSEIVPKHVSGLAFDILISVSREEIWQLFETISVLCRSIPITNFFSMDNVLAYSIVIVTFLFHSMKGTYSRIGNLGLYRDIVGFRCGQVRQGICCLISYTCAMNYVRIPAQIVLGGLVRAFLSYMTDLESILAHSGPSV